MAAKSGPESGEDLGLEQCVQKYESRQGLDREISWFHSTLIPQWLNRAIDTEFGGFYDRLSSDGAPFAADPKTTLVQARLLFTLSHLILSGHSTPELRSGAATAHGFLTGHLRHPESGYVRAVGFDGASDGLGANPVRDCYDHAFVLLGLAAYGRVAPSACLKDQLQECWSMIDTLFHDPETGGVQEDDRAFAANSDATMPRRQNPHMHMFEALLFTYEATGETIWLERAEGLLQVFHTYLFDAETGTLREFLNESLGSLATDAGRIREPGHHLEWTWLLYRYRALGGAEPAADRARVLFDFAMQHGRHEIGPLAGAFYDEVRPDGQVLTPTLLLWPQTEAVKACLARFEENGDASFRDQARYIAKMIFAKYFDTTKASWCNQLDTSGAVLQADSLSRLMYHIAVFVTEGERLRAWRVW